ncbi:MAG: tetratricopeptide repeat protein [Calditrichae bacterium]|nr:tetratricopeptide repeat protein [Calditrichia bacterium]
MADTVSQYSLWKARALVQKGLQSSPIKKPYYAHQAKKYFQKAVRLNPQNTLARQDLIEFYMRAPGILGGDADKAIKQAQLLQEQNCWEGYKAYGKIYTIEGRFNKAEDTYLAAIEEYPDEMQFYLYLADLYLKHKQFDKAIAICQRVITEMPQKALDMRYKLANIYQQTEHYQEAFAIFEEIIRLKPNQMRAFYQFGCTSILAQQNLERGKESLIQYISHKLKYGCPSLAKAYYKLGQIYELVDNRDEARQQYTLALRINPDYHQASEALAQWQ